MNRVGVGLTRTPACKDASLPGRRPPEPPQSRLKAKKTTHSSLLFSLFTVAFSMCVITVNPN